MAALVRYNCFTEDLCNLKHDLFGTDHELRAILSNTAPDVAADLVLADAAEITAGNGYPAGGVDIQNVGTRSGAVTTIVATDATITALGGAIGPFRYCIIYNNTSATDPLIGYYDRGASVTLDDGDAVVLNFGAFFLQI